MIDEIEYRLVDNAPVTRTFVIASAIFTVFFGIQGRFNKLGLSYEVPLFVWCSFLADLLLIFMFNLNCFLNLEIDGLNYDQNRVFF